MQKDCENRPYLPSRTVPQLGSIVLRNTMHAASVGQPSGWHPNCVQ